MNNTDRIECLEFISDGKYAQDLNTILELLNEMDNLTPVMYDRIRVVKDWYTTKVYTSGATIETAQTLTEYLKEVM